MKGLWCVEAGAKEQQFEVTKVGSLLLCVSYAALKKMKAYSRKESGKPQPTTLIIITADQPKPALTSIHQLMGDDGPR